MNGVSLVPDRLVVATAVVATAVLFVSDAADPVNVVKLTALLLCALALLVLAVRRVATDRVLRLPAGAPALTAGLLAVALVVATVVAPHTSTAVYGTYGRNSGLLAYAAALLLFAVVLRARDTGTVRAVAFALVLGGAFSALYGLLQYAGVDAIGWNNPFNPIIAALGNPNFAAAYMAIATPPAVWGALWTGWPVPPRVASGLVAVLCLAAAGLSDAVQGPLAAAGGLTVLAAAVALGRSGRVRRLGLGAVGLAGVAGTAVLVLGLLGVGPGRAFFAGISYRARTWYWEGALHMFERSPVWGVGLDSYGIRWRQERPLEVVRELGGDHFSDAAHSVPLQMLGQGGLVLGLAYVAFVVTVGTCLVRGLLRLEGQERLLLGGVGGAWAAYQVQSLVSIDQVPLLVAHFALAGAVVVASGAGRLREVRLPGALPLPTTTPAAGRRRAPVLPKERTASGVDHALTAVAVLVALVLAWPALGLTRAARASFAGDSALGRGEGTAALQDYERAADIDHHAPLYLTKQGELYNRVQQPAPALAAYREAADRDPFDLGALRTAGRLADAQGQFDVARRYFLRAAQLDPDNSGTVLDLTQFQLRRGQAQEARDRLEPLVRLLPQDAGLWATLGDARLVTGDAAGARTAYETALRLQPGQEVATAGLKKLGGGS